MNRNSKDFFQAISEFHHHIGIYLTYTLDPKVIDKLTESARGTKLILHDFTQGKNLDDNDTSNIVCLPLKMLKSHVKNCFHSKLALLKGENSAKLIVGSANLSIDSFVTDKEIALEIELKFENKNDVFLYNRVISFIENLKPLLVFSNGVLEQTLEKLRFTELPEKENDTEFVSNSSEESIYNKLKNYLTKNRREQKVKSIKIVTPFVSNEYQSMDEIKNICRDISVYVRKGARIEPFKKLQFKIFQPLTRRREGFHSKLILVEYDTDCVLFIGSANFTEQGFYRTQNESANHECGIVLRVSKDEMNEWFRETLWKQLTESELENYIVAEDNSVEVFESPEKCYAWAELNNFKVTTYIFNPCKFPVSKTKEGKKIDLLTMDQDSFFMTNELEAQNQKVTFYVGVEKISIPVFEMKDYLAGLNERGESIFNSFRGICAVNPEELDLAIDREKLSVSETIKIDITEPPKLEQFYYNVKGFLQRIKNKKYFSDYNEREIREEITKTSDGRTLYLTLQLFKLFKTKNNTNALSQLCMDRIEELAIDLNIDRKKLNKFIKGWLTSRI